MTITEFLSTLRKTPRAWYLTENGKLICRVPTRRYLFRLGPLETVAVQMGLPLWSCRSSRGPLPLILEDIGDGLGLSDDLLESIDYASLFPTGSLLRAQLIDACGLTEHD
jgi:hypothetical protein